jgi:hypothetical protein
MRTRSMVGSAAIVCLAAGVVFLAWPPRSPAPSGSNREHGETSLPRLLSPALESPRVEREHELPAEAAATTPSAPAPDAQPGGVGGASILLHVVDRHSLAELGEVTVSVDRALFFIDGDDIPSADRLGATLVEHATSPIRIAYRPDRDNEYGNRVVWARAAGFSWAHVEIDFTKPDSTVALVPAADLRVELRGRLPDASRGTARLRVRDPNVPGEGDGDQSEGAPSKTGLVIFDEVATLGTTAILGLRDLPLVVAVEIGDRHRPPLVLATTKIDPVVGHTTRVTLVVEEIAPVERVPLAGTLFIPSTWPGDEWARESIENAPEEQKLAIRPLDVRGATDDDEQSIALSAMSSIEGTPGAFRWRARPVQPGRYSFLLQAAGWALAVDVPRGGCDDLALVIPEAATLQVRVTDAKDGSPVSPEGVYWRRDADGVRDVLWGVPLLGATTPGGFEGHVPVGPGRVYWSDEKWQVDPSTASAEIHAGSQEIAVTARRRRQITLRLVCRGAPVPWEWSVARATRIEPMGSAVASDASLMSSEIVQFGVPSRGRYRITFPSMMKFGDVPPIEVEVVDDDIERVIELTPL